MPGGSRLVRGQLGHDSCLSKAAKAYLGEDGKRCMVRHLTARTPLKRRSEPLHQDGEHPEDRGRRRDHIAQIQAHVELVQRVAGPSQRSNPDWRPLPDDQRSTPCSLLFNGQIGWFEVDSWNKPELEPRGAIIAKLAGYGTAIAYVPSPTQCLSQLSASESSSGESPLLVQGMDYDTIVYVHCGEVWARRTCREQQENIADWHRLEELSDAMHLTQKGCCQLKEARGTAGNRNADEPVLGEYYTGIRPAWIAAELLGLRPGAHWPRCSYCWRRTLLFGTCEECVGAPCLRYCCRTFDGKKLCPEHWPRRPDSLGQRQQIWPSALELDA